MALVGYAPYPNQRLARAGETVELKFSSGESIKAIVLDVDEFGPSLTGNTVNRAVLVEPSAIGEMVPTGVQIWGVRAA